MGVKEKLEGGTSKARQRDLWGNNPVRASNETAVRSLLYSNHWVTHFTKDV